ncbi:ABC transporter permease [Natribaculum luteum]|uniref:ABC transporter permease n=1 Tax=Natribaculum luteum TaxID=1586232 RepID=A0ABD5P2F8_9EURY|nr:ABC transporter permease subunit [Natribaculum luteum]
MNGETGTGTATPAETEHEADVGERATPSQSHVLETIVRRELQTVRRTRTFLLLGFALTVVLLGVAWVGGGVRGGYVPTAVDLLTPLELLIPIVAVAFGYRAVLADERRGELDVLRTYPVSSWQVVGGAYLGRAAGLVTAVAFPLVVVALAVALTGTEEVRIYATHAGADSPILFARVVVLTILFALVVLAVAIAISAVASTTRSALALAVVALVVVLVGADLAIVYGLASGFVGDSSLVYTLALSPISAYRGLVLETAVVVASGTGPRTAAPIASLLGLFLWAGVSLAVATVAVRRS